ncbi:hypothetical protein T12_9860 [Trichinella patagoniensis]|uniref:Uncharacterized protein n=1 Tax=Trichinella patagoniensis TaxID=990121 RepID=A0A0V0YQ60_9BILA|nr:hypothetical protein T12_9860 [Trichinella patagoniensis]
MIPRVSSILGFPDEKGTASVRPGAGDWLISPRLETGEGMVASSPAASMPLVVVADMAENVTARWPR